METEKRFQELGKYLKKQRVLAGYSQGDIGKKLGYSSPQFISNFERGNCAPPLVALKTLVNLYKMNVEEVIDLILKEQESYLRQKIS